MKKQSVNGSLVKLLHDLKAYLRGIEETEAQKLHSLLSTELEQFLNGYHRFMKPPGGTAVCVDCGQYQNFILSECPKSFCDLNHEWEVRIGVICCKVCEMCFNVRGNNPCSGNAAPIGPRSNQASFVKPAWAGSQFIRRDRGGMVEDICKEHGVGHPNKEWLATRGSGTHDSIHGCCGCCSAIDSDSSIK